MQDRHLPRTALEELRRHVIEERDKRREVMLARLDHVDTDKLGRRLASVAEALDASTEEGWRAVLSARILTRAGRLEDAVQRAGQMYQPERLHAVRIAAKKLRYGLELAADSGVRSASPLVRRIKRVQDLLGRLHDFQVLQEHIAIVQSGPAASREGMHDALAALAGDVEARCRHLHGQYLMTAASVQDLIETVRARVVTEVERPRTRRPLKMTLHRKAPARAAAGRR
jgi:CHAD domain-containing protein